MKKISRCSKCGKSILFRKSVKHPDMDGVKLCKRCYNDYLDDKIEKFRKSLPDIKLELEKEEKKRFKENEKYKKRNIEKIKNKKFDKDLISNVPNLNLRGKKSLYIKGEGYTVDYCLNSFFHELRSNGVTSILLLRDNVDTMDNIKEYEFIISDLPDNCLKQIERLRDTYAASYWYKAVIQINNLYTCRYCKYHFESSKSFVCPRCGKTN